MKKYPAPYTFVPVVVPSTVAQQRLFNAVFHDGSADCKEHFSGELHCTLTALTPLLAGQRRYLAKQIEGCSAVESIRFGDDEKECILLPENWGSVGGGDNLRYLEADKGVLEPMFLGIKEGMKLEHKQVIIPGSSLKGMLRHNLGAILGAPMERVGEQYFSYRPNLAVSNMKQNKYQSYLAVVLEADEENRNIEVAIIDPNDLTSEGVQDHHKAGSPVYYMSRLRRVLSYSYSIDRKGEMAKAAKKYIGHKKDRVLIKEDILNDAQTRLTIPEEVVQQYLKTNEELADRQYGHISRPPYSNYDNKNLIEDCIKKNNNLIFERYRLIYIEAELDPDAKPIRVVSFGHHFRYRWRYADTVRTVRNEAGRNVLRQQVSPLVGEGVKDDKGQLSGARLLFGYAVDDSPMSGTKGLGEGNFSRLAGRIAINHAVEHFNRPTPTLQQRFVLRSDVDSNKEDLSAFNIPLKILGAPKASAVEHYLVQDKVNQRGWSEHTVTYGDLPGVLTSESVLSGRKFYRHQSLAATDNSLFELKENRHDKQATLARFISKPGTRFRFTLRFKDLRLWEIGALIVALQPDVLIERQNRGYALTQEQQAFLNKVRALRGKSAQHPIFALKLGYGRPLGLGSISACIDRVKLLTATGEPEQQEIKEQDENQWIDHAVKAFLELVKTRQLPLFPWLSAALYAGATQAAYPTAADNKGNYTIFNYHTGIRREHAKVRRLEKNNTKVEPLDELVKPSYPEFTLESK